MASSSILRFVVSECTAAMRLYFLPVLRFEGRLSRILHSRTAETKNEEEQRNVVQHDSRHFMLLQEEIIRLQSECEMRQLKLERPQLENLNPSAEMVEDMRQRIKTLREEIESTKQSVPEWPADNREAFVFRIRRIEMEKAQIESNKEGESGREQSKISEDGKCGA